MASWVAIVSLHLIFLSADSTWNGTIEERNPPGPGKPPLKPPEQLVSMKAGGPDCGFKPVKPMLGPVIGADAMAIWQAGLMGMDNIVRGHCDLNHVREILRVYRMKKSRNEFCIGFVVDCGNFFALRVMYPPKKSLPGLMYVRNFDSVEAKNAASFNITGLKGNMTTSLPWKKSQDAAKQSQLIGVNPTTTDCQTPKALKHETYLYEAADSFWTEKHMFYFFPVMCKVAATGLWELRHMLVLQSDKGGVEFQGFKHIDVFLFAQEEKPNVTGGTNESEASKEAGKKPEKEDGKTDGSKPENKPNQN